MFLFVVSPQERNELGHDDGWNEGSEYMRPFNLPENEQSQCCFSADRVYHVRCECQILSDAIGALISCALP